MCAILGNSGGHILSFSTTCNTNMAKARTCELRAAVTPLFVDSSRIKSLRQMCNVLRCHFLNIISTKLWLHKSVAPFSSQLAGDL